MTQILVVDQKAMAKQAMATLLKSISEVSEIVERKPTDFNRQQMRAFEAKMRPYRIKLAQMRRKQEELQAKIDALAVSDVTA